MVASDHPVLRQYQALYETTLRLLELARQERWNEAEALIALQKQQVTALQTSNASLDQLPEALRADLEIVLRNTESANDEIVRRADLWKSTLSSMLEDISTARTNVRRLVRAYG